MLIFLQALVVASAACCILLTVAIINRRKRWAKWMLAMVIGVPLLYVASFGPVCWYVSQNPYARMENDPFAPIVPNMYCPFGWLMVHGPEPVARLVHWYAFFQADQIMLATEPGGQWWVFRKNRFLQMRGIPQRAKPWPPNPDSKSESN